MNYDAVIFDLDGTLCDTLPDIHRSVNLTLAALGFPEREFAHTALGINHGSRRLIAHALPEGADEKTVTDTLALYMKLYGDHLCDTTAPYPGISKLLSRLSESGVKLAILSNKPDVLTKRLAEHCFPGVFDVTVGQGQYPAKPSPEAPLAVADMLSTTPDRVLFVGDSDVDIITAHNAGMTSVGVNWGYRSCEVLVNAGAEHIADAPDEIYDIIMMEENK